MTIEHGQRTTDGTDGSDETGEPGVNVRVDRTVALYLVVAAAWVGVSSIVAEFLVDHTPLPLAAVEMSKGLAFVAVTGLVLRAVLRRWAGRLVAAAEAEHRAAERLRDAEEIRSRFLRGISHELRTPLTNIIGYGMTINSRVHDLDAQRLEQFSDRLVVNARRLQRLVLDLLDVDRLARDDDAVSHEDVRVDQLVARVVSGLVCPDHEIHVEADTIVATLDRVKTERIAEELVRNAVRHTPEGTRIWVRVVSAGDRLHLLVEDEGPGVESGLGDHVFEPFVQGRGADHAASPGLGIGLTLVDRYARLQGGRVRLDARPGGGASFSVTLPTGPRAPA